MRRIYFDNNATTPLLPEVFVAMRPWLESNVGNASSIHHHGQEARAAVEAARESVAKLFGCRPAEVVFTSGGTEGDNLALFGILKAGDHLITTTVEHHAVLLAAERWREMGAQGGEVTFVPVDGCGRVDPEDIRRALRPNTRLISVMLANNETGVIQPIAEIGEIAAGAGVEFHTDAVQGAGKVPLDVRALGVSLLSISGHKVHAPQGVGALYVRKGTKLQPLFYGGRHERSRRAGTENTPGIVALGKAAEVAHAGLTRGEDARLAAMRDRLEQGILAQVEASGVNGGGVACTITNHVPRVPNTTNLYFDHIEGEPLIIALDLKGLACSTGAACSSGAIEPSHVLTAMRLGGERARGSVRLSLGKQNTDEEVDFALELIPQTVARLREISPTWRRAVAQ